MESIALLMGIMREAGGAASTLTKFAATTISTPQDNMGRKALTSRPLFLPQFHQINLIALINQNARFAVFAA